MAITISTQPDAIHPAFNPVLWKVTSDRFPSGLIGSKSVTSVADNGSGKCRFTFSGAHGYILNSLITGSGFSEDTYNVLQTVTAVGSSTQIDTDIDYVAGDSGSTLLTNNDFKVKAEVRISAVSQAALWAKATVEGGTTLFRFDVSDILKTLVSEDLGTFGATNIESGASSDSSVSYTVKFIEYFEDVDGLLQDYDNATSSAKRAFNFAKQDNETFDDYICDGATKLVLTDRPQPIPIHYGQDYHLHFITDQTPLKIGYRINGVNQSPTALVTINNNHGIIPIGSLLTTATYSATIFLVDASSDYAAPIYFRVMQKCTNEMVRIEFKNRKGGFDQVSFMMPNITSNQSKTVSEIDGIKYVTGVKSRRVYSLETEVITRAELLWMEQLYESKVVNLISGTTRIPVIISSTDHETAGKDLFVARCEMELNDTILN